MKKLIKSYSVILIIIITIFAITVGYVTSKRDYDEAVLQNKAISQKMTEIIESYEQDLRKIVFDLFRRGSCTKYERLLLYGSAYVLYATIITRPLYLLS
ncbi:hypothetical protein [Erysipelothrix piscisicarius]|uniref:hypothetical protein n=1 Tax=Erysipelothrix piscisicarius TaxID=2485784 RepID=UPI001E2C32AD|nr:hypothetical protein [Erysipelothrix piscisicarius]